MWALLVAVSVACTVSHGPVSFLEPQSAVSFLQVRKESSDFVNSHPLLGAGKKNNDPKKSEVKAGNPTSKAKPKDQLKADRLRSKAETKQREKERKAREAAAKARKRARLSGRVQARDPWDAYRLNSPYADTYNQILTQKQYAPGELTVFKFAVPSDAGGIEAPKVVPMKKTDVARGKPATQSSTGFGAEASRAVDGDNNPLFGANHCAHTGQIEVGWWRVDLGQVYRVEYVKVTNRGDCCSERLTNFNVRVGNSLEGGYGSGNTICSDSTQPVMGAGETRKIECNNAEGRYVSIALTEAGVLSLCGVEVFAPAPPHFTTHPASVSVFRGQDTMFTSEAEHAAGYQWFRGSTALIDSERVYGSQTRRLVIARTKFSDVGNDYHVVASGIGGTTSSNMLSITVLPDFMESLGLFKPATASSHAPNGLPSHAVDGVADPIYENGHCARTEEEENPFWRVDLGRRYAINTIRILNREGAQSVKLKDFYVGLSNITIDNGIFREKTQQSPDNIVSDDVYLCGPAPDRQLDLHSEVPSATVRGINCQGVVGKYVIIQLPRRDTLTLCNVQVFGYDIPRPILPVDCKDALTMDVPEEDSGIVRIMMRPDTRIESQDEKNSPSDDQEGEIVYTKCDMNTFDGGWTLVLRQNVTTRSDAAVFPPKTFRLNSDHPDAEAYSILDRLDMFTTPLEKKIEFLLKWPDNPEVEEQYWLQSNLFAEEPEGQAIRDFKPVLCNSDWKGLFSEPTGNTALLAFQGDGFRGYLGMYYFLEDGIQTREPEQYANVVELYARQHEVVSTVEEPQPTVSHENLEMPPPESARMPRLERPKNMTWRDEDMTNIEALMGAEESFTLGKTQGNTHVQMSQSNVDPSDRVEYREDGVKKTYQEGLQHGLDDFWSSYKSAALSGFSKGFKQGQTEVLSKYQQAYNKKYSESFHGGKEEALSEKQQAQMIGSEPSSEPSAVSSADSPSPNSDSGSPSPSQKKEYEPPSSGEEEDPKKGGTNGESADERINDARQGGKGGGSDPIEEQDEVSTKSDQDAATQEANAARQKAREDAKEGGSPAAIDPNNVGTEVLFQATQEATSPQPAYDNDDDGFFYGDEPHAKSTVPNMEPQILLQRPATRPMPIVDRWALIAAKQSSDLERIGGGESSGYEGLLGEEADDEQEQWLLPMAMTTQAHTPM